MKFRFVLFLFSAVLWCGSNSFAAQIDNVSETVKEHYGFKIANEAVYWLGKAGKEMQEKKSTKVKFNVGYLPSKEFRIERMTIRFKHDNFDTEVTMAPSTMEGIITQTSFGRDVVKFHLEITKTEVKITASPEMKNEEIDIRMKGIADYLRRPFSERALHFAKGGWDYVARTFVSAGAAVKGGWEGTWNNAQEEWNSWNKGKTMPPPSNIDLSAEKPVAPTTQTPPPTKADIIQFLIAVEDAGKRVYTSRALNLFDHNVSLPSDVKQELESLLNNLQSSQAYIVLLDKEGKEFLRSFNILEEIDEMVKNELTKASSLSELEVVKDHATGKEYVLLFGKMVAMEDLEKLGLIEKK